MTKIRGESDKTTLNELTEEDVVQLITEKIVNGPGVGEYLKHPDDARDLLPKAPRILLSMDAYSIESLMLPWRTRFDLGWASLTGAISDIVAKGGIPYACMIALGLPKTMRVESLEELLDGIYEASKYYGVKILGGDTNSSIEEWIAVSVIGFTTAKTPPSRRGLKPGDIIVATGIYGAMGYVVKHGFEKSMKEPWVVTYTKRPKVKVEQGYVIESNYRFITASMDVSDGLGYTLNELSKLSGYGLKLTNPPKTPEKIIEICDNSVECIMEYALIGGEEYGVVIGIKPEGFKNVVKELEYFNVDYATIGVVASSEPGVYINDKKVSFKRYDQFKKWV
ncbi:MAG: thiamine-phosphate kinase [Desulfurococcaceae archaeon]